jgi:TetR/AcrR family transcriptional repressor of nem operon
VLAALGADAARQERPVRTAFREGLTRLVDILTASLTGSKAARRRRAIAAMAQMVGAIVLSRAVDDSALSDEILAAAKHDLLARENA